MEIFVHLDKSNCRECGKTTCLAFAGAVFKGEKNITECPRLKQSIIDQFSDASDELSAPEQAYEEFLSRMQNEIGTIDLEEAATRTGGVFRDGRLTIRILGKSFGVDRQGRLFSDIHMNPWVIVPFFNHVISGRGTNPSGQWVSFRDIPGAAERYPLFRKRCEEAMKRVADTYTDLFDDIVQVLNGKEVEQQFQSDISVVMYPLPKVPVMICYWAPDEGLGSSLNVFFDSTAHENIDVGSIFNLGAGLAQMFERMSVKHGALMQST